jgi:hypothetical protein
MRSGRGFVLLSLLVLSLGCKPSEPIEDQASSTPSPDASATAEAAKGKTQFAIDAQETVYSNASATAEVRQTAKKAAEETQEEELRATRKTATAESTSQAQPMADLVEELYESGYLSATDGVYYTLADFDERWAQLGWYQYWRTGHSPTDFVLRADAQWDSASDTANWQDSGCGFVFRGDSKEENHYRVYLGLDGYVYMSGYYNDIYRQLGRSYYGKVDVPSGKANIMLVVEGSQFTFFVNDQRVHSQYDTAIKSGRLSLTLVSGTNKDFGTRCKMTNIELWKFEE